MDRSLVQAETGRSGIRNRMRNRQRDGENCDARHSVCRMGSGTYGGIVRCVDRLTMGLSSIAFSTDAPTNNAVNRSSYR